MMSSKSRARNLALLGGLGAAAYLASRKKDADSDSQYEAQDKQEGRPTPAKRATPVAAPAPVKKIRADSQYEQQDLQEGGRQGAPFKMEGVTASGLPREARGVRNPIAEGVTASGLPREARGIADTRTPGQKYAARQERAADVVNRARREQLGLKNGGMLKDVDAESNPGLSKLPEAVRNKMGYKRAGGKVSSASKRADGICKKGKTKGRFV